MARNKDLDATVEKLYAQVQLKKEALKTAEKPNPYNTDCNFRYAHDGAIYNLMSVRHVTQLVEMLAFLIGKQANHAEACKMAGVDVPCNWLSVEVSVWQADIVTRITQLTLSTKKAELANLEKDLLELANPEMLRNLKAKALAAKLESIG